MASRSSAALLAALGALVALVVSGCRLHVTAVVYGGEWTPVEAEALRSESSDRGAVLAALGPPDLVTYTLDEEVLVYRRAGHRGTDLRFLIPDPGLNLGRPGLEELAPDLQRPEDFSGEAPPIVALRTVVETLFGFLAPLSSDEAVSMHARRLRWDVVRVVLDRATLRVRSIDVYRGIGGAEAGRIEARAPAAGGA